MPTSTSIDPAALRDSIQDAWKNVLLTGRGLPNKAEYVYASAWRACERRMTLDMTEGDKVPPYDVDTLARFRRGDDREREILADLARIGRDCNPPFRLIGQQERFTLRDHKGRIAIVGKVDARVELPDKARPPVEVKAWNPMLVAKIKRFEDLFDNVWTRSGAHQIIVYLFAAGEPYGFLVLDRAGLPLILPVELMPNLDRVEEFLSKAERALDHKEAGTLPDFINDAAECKRCPFYGSVCNPPLSAAGAVVITDPELEAALERREELRESAKEYDDLDSDIKAKLRGVEMGISGRFVIEGKWSKTTKLELPEEIKKKYQKTIEKGKFSLSITRL